MECNGGPDPSFICIYRLLLILVHLPAILLLCIIDLEPDRARSDLPRSQMDISLYKINTSQYCCSDLVIVSDKHS